MNFVNLAPWPEGVPVVECILENRVTIDLHNVSKVAKIAFLPPGIVSLEFELLPEHFVDDRLYDIDPKASLEFHGVRSLQLVQPDQWVPDESNDFEHLVYYENDDDTGQIDVTAAGLSLSFKAKLALLMIRAKPQ